MKKQVGVFIVFLFSLSGTAQMYFDDAQLWLNLEVEKKLGKKWGLQLNLKGRGTYNVTQVGRAAADLGIFYKFNKHIRLRADYVYVEKRRKNNSFKTQHQYCIVLILKKDFGRWSLVYKNKFQARYENFSSTSDGYIPRYYDRNKLMIKHETTKRFSFYVAEEVYIPLNNPQIKGLSRSRSYVGSFINVTKNQKLELYFLYQLQLQQGDWFDQDISYPLMPLKRDFVYGIGYCISI